MKNRIIVYLLGAALLITSIAFSGCVEETENKIIVGTSADYPPFEYVEDGVIVGFDIELITALKGEKESLAEKMQIQEKKIEDMVAQLETLRSAREKAREKVVSLLEKIEQIEI